MLADQGADVVHVDPPGGPRWQHPSDAFYSRGKRRITLDLKDAGDLAIAQRLVDGADVVVENFRPGVMDRLGLGYRELCELNPSLVYCAISGFGQNGPMRDAPAYDQIIQGLSGMMSVTGNEDSGPLRAGYPVADTVGGITAAFAIAAALVRRLRTGEGSLIDVSMLDSAIVGLGWVVSNYLVAGVTPLAIGNENFTAAPSGTFGTGRGLLNIAANKQEQFEALAKALGREDLVADRRFAGRECRKRNRAALTRELESALAHKSAAEWETALNHLGVPAGRVLTVPEALEVAQIKERELLQVFENVPGVDRSITLARSGFKMSCGDPAVSAPPPQLGEHTAEILHAIGYSSAEIGRLRQAGAV
jgi:crotonobetainyl-CoA:carnitine CoA-transferase CaiB-like acyl-CoA transferase